MEESIDDLIQKLGSKDEFEREEATGALEMRSEESLNPLIEALSNKDKNIRRYSAQVLGYIGKEEAIQPLIDTLEDKNKFVRREASTALTRIGDPAFEPLTGLVNNDDWRIRGAAAWALGSMKKEEALKYLEPLLEDESGFVRAGAKNAIHNIKSATN